MRVNMSLANYGVGSNRLIQLREHEVGYEVVNSEDFKDLTTPRIINMGKELLDSNSRTIKMTRKNFEEHVKKDFGTINLEWLN